MFTLFEDVGALPAYVLSLALQGRSIVRITSVSDKSFSGFTVVTSVGTRCAAVTYLTGFLDRDNMEDLSRLFAAPLDPLVTIMKSGAHDVARRDWFGRQILGWSSAVLQDESGLTPKQFQESGWAITPHGNFTDFTKDQQARFEGDAEQIRSLYAQGSQLLPLQFGYLDPGRLSALMVGASLLPSRRPTSPAAVSGKESPWMWVILSTQRSGSSWLSSLAGCHQKVLFHEKQEAVINWTSSHMEFDWHNASFFRYEEDLERAVEQLAHGIERK